MHRKRKSAAHEEEEKSDSLTGDTSSLLDDREIARVGTSGVLIAS